MFDLTRKGRELFRSIMGKPEMLYVDAGVVRLPLYVEQSSGRTVVQPRGDCWVDYRTGILTRQVVTCVPMDDLVEIVRRYCRDAVADSDGNVGDFTIGVDVVRMGITKRAAEAVLNYMVDNDVSLVEGENVTFNVVPGGGKSWTHNDQVEYCRALSRGSLLCFRKGK